MDNYSKKQSDFFKQIERAIESGDDEALDFLLRQKDAYGVRKDISSTLGKHVLDNYDKVDNIYLPKSLEDLSKLKGEIITELPKDVAGQFSPKTDTIQLNKKLLKDPVEFTATKLHERQHFLDKIKDKLFKSQGLDDVAAKASRGLESASKLFDPHHLGGFFEREALQKLLTGAKLSHMPYLAGAAALGAGLYSGGAKALEGDFKGATKDIGEVLIPDEIKIQSLGEGSDKPGIPDPRYGTYSKVDDSNRSEKDVPMRYSDMQALSKKLNEAYVKKNGK